MDSHTCGGWQRSSRARHAAGPCFEVLIAFALCGCLASDASAQFAALQPCPTGPLPPGVHDISLGGIVLDPTGHRGQAGVTIVIQNEVTGEECERTTGPAGLYQIRNILPGCYQLEFKKRSFRPAWQRVVVPADPAQGDPEMMHIFIDPAAADSRTLYISAETIVLQLGTEEELTVTSERTLLNAGEGSTGVTFARHDIESLPLTNGRTLQAALNLVPGIVVTNSIGTLAQFTAAGQRRFANRLTIDGLEADFAVDIGASLGPAASGALPAAATSGGTQTLVPLVAVEEIQVHTANAPPELARAPGANIAIVTRAGGDRFTGSLFEDFRPHPLGASDWFAKNGGVDAPPKRENQLSDTGVSTGGPIMPQRLFLFASWERQQFDRQANTAVAVPSKSLRDNASPALQPLLNAYPEPNGAAIGKDQAAYGHGFPAASDLSVWNVRIDGNLSARHHLFARLNTGTSSGDALTPDGQLPNYSFTNTEATTTQTMTAAFTSVLSSSLLHDVRANISLHDGTLTTSPAAYGDADWLPLGGFVGPGQSAADSFVAISLFAGPSGRLLSGQASTDATRQFQIVDSLSIVKGRHEWRVGGDYVRLTTATTRPSNEYTYTFGSLKNYQLGKLQEEPVQDHLLPAKVLIDHWSLFAQDSFRLSPRLTLDYGIRYRIAPAPSSLTKTQPYLITLEKLPEVIERRSENLPLWDTSWTDIEPRVAATWQMRTTPGRETTFRAGWSLMVDDLANPGATAFGRGYPFVSERVIDSKEFPVSPDTLAAPFPEPLDRSEFGDHSEYYSFPRDLRSPRTYAWQVGFEQALGSVQRLGLAYAGSAGRDLVYPYTYYLADPKPIVHVYANAATSDSHALLAEYVRRLSRGLQARVAYSWSHTIDTDSGETLEPQAPPESIAPQQNRGSADFDRRHVFAGTLSYQLPAIRAGALVHALCANWQLDVGVNLQSGAPFSVMTTQKIEIAGLGAGSYTVRPNLADATVPLWIAESTDPSTRRLNPLKFLEPHDNSPQVKLGRNTFHAPALRQLDLALSRSIAVHGRGILRVRVDAFNILNLVNLDAPRHLWSRESPIAPNDPFGRSYQTYADALGTGTLSYGGLTPLQQLGGPRAIQFGLRFDF